jgi:hypothetical protein
MDALKGKAKAIAGFHLTDAGSDLSLLDNALLKTRQGFAAAAQKFQPAQSQAVPKTNRGIDLAISSTRGEAWGPQWICMPLIPWKDH